ncbi:proton-conducting transporter membrane subunit, partial [Azospirillum sp. B506]|uniref:proton-conducting transporter transmembrane domain-containing protein n=1 Tax=Azospirillum sp. B506 TaxID=137721 RepID=UPI0005B27E68
MSTHLLPLLAPLALLLAAFAGFRDPGRRPASVPRAAEAAALTAVIVALLSAGLLALAGAGTSPLIGAHGIGLSVRLDAVSATMLVLVSFVGWTVVRYTATYLDGEDRQGAFTGWLCATLASVLLLVQAGNLTHFVMAWIATSLFLHRLLLFYPDRPTARRAARKKAVTARAGDAALIGAAILLAVGYRTSDIATIAEVARAGQAVLQGSALAVCTAGLIALAALLKSAQFPTHGWVTEVMETPTPVSALLHAGVINGGGFLLIRFADPMLLAPGVLSVL